MKVVPKRDSFCFLAAGDDANKTGDAQHLNLKVKSQDGFFLKLLIILHLIAGNEIYFKVKKSTEFKKVMIGNIRMRTFPYRIASLLW